MFTHSYAALGSQYATPCSPSPVADPQWLAFNDTLAGELNWPAADTDRDLLLNAFGGNSTLPDTQPVATVYAGHQFGGYNPQLGDGRALLMGEWLDGDGKRWDIQLKGAGPTPYSRGGDGRSPLGPVVREYLVSEAMHALGVPTTRALAAVTTGERVYRQTPEPGAILTRVAPSHLRIGTVQFFAMTQAGDGLEALVEYACQRHYAQALAAQQGSDKPLAAAAVLLQQTVAALTQLVAQWQSLGFIHGVLNTDNMLLCGHTVDYGPCAFMDRYDAKKVFSSIDQQGRYAFQNQPGIVHWNLSVLAQCLLPLIAEDSEGALAFAQAEIDRFPELYSQHYALLMAQKLGLNSVKPTDQALVEQLLGVLQADALDYTLAFRWITEAAADNLNATPLEALFEPSESLRDWFAHWQSRWQQQDDPETQLTVMQSRNPVVIPRNHWVASAITAAEAGEYGLFEQLSVRWQSPSIWQAGDEQWAASPTPEEEVTRTFCGT